MIRGGLLVLALAMAACASRAESKLPLELTIEDKTTQGALIQGRVTPGAQVTLDGKGLRTTADGRFVLGFGRDQGPSAVLTASKDGTSVSRTLAIAPRSYDVQRIDGLPEQQVTPPAGVLERIKREAAHIAALRKLDSDELSFLGPFDWPAIGRVSGVYGSQRVLNGEARQPHLALDIAAPVGTPVHDTAGGRVVMAEKDLYYTGGTIVVDHGFGVESIYCHLSALDVKVGDIVKRGQRIGAVGKTGRATGPHLHWGISWREERLDPALIVSGEMPRAGGQ